MNESTTKKLYEVGYLLVPLIPEDKVADEVNILLVSQARNVFGILSVG